MSFRSMIAASIAATAALAVTATVALSRAPAGMRLPTHWNAAGEPDRFASAGTALFMPVIMCAGLSALLAVIPSIEPMQRKLDQSAPLYRTAWAGLLLMMALIEVQIAAPIFGFHPPATSILAGMGVLLILIGNMLPKSRPGYFVGIRTPWTLTDPENWIATHRLGSRTMMVGGALIILLALLPLSAEVRMTGIIAAIMIAVVPPMLYSFFYYWRRTHAH